MNSFLRTSLGLCILSVILFSCASQKGLTGKTIRGLKFLSEFDLPHRLQFQGTTVGGLSGIDYNKERDEYYLICDDRSDLNPARFYTMKIPLSVKGIDTVQLLGVTSFTAQNGKSFPNKTQDPLHVPDPEAMRYNPVSNTLVWSSEGERIVRKDKLILEDPAIYLTNLQGQVTDTFPIPPNMHMHRTENGPRQNGVFEGLAFANNYNTLYVSVEEPIYEDGPRAGLDDTTGWVRIIKYDVPSRQPVAQYAYRIDPVVQEPISRGAFIVNGIPDILAINDHQLLVTERSFSTGRLTCNIRVYLAELNGAENIAGVESLQSNPPKNPVQKTLLLNMDKLGRWTDNVEGATFGPILPNGKRSLLFVSDDNFAPFERTQFFLFEVQ